MSKTYARHMADVAFHARNARFSLERAQAKAPEDDRAQIDTAITVAEGLRSYASETASRAASRGGVRQVTR